MPATNAHAGQSFNSKSTAELYYSSFNYTL